MTGVVVRNQGLGMYVVSTATGLTIVDEIPFNEWREVLEKLSVAGERFAWSIGDMLAFGDKTFRESYRDALEQIDRKFGAFENYKWVAKHVERSTRVENLSWSHHRAVAAVKTAEEQARWLDSAERLGWNVHELEAAIREARAEEPRAITAPALMVRATGELYNLCTEEAHRVDVPAPEWAARGLEWLVANGSPHLVEAA